MKIARERGALIGLSTLMQRKNIILTRGRRGKLEYGNAGEEPGLMVVTELPKEMFKKPRLKNDFGQNSGDHGDGNLYKPVFSKRNASKIPMSRDKESRKYQSTKPAGNSKWSDCMTQAEEEERISQPTTGKTKASKWKDYITQDEDGFNSGRGRNVGAHHQNCGDWENILDDDQKVEDDVHPDFM
uniref:Aminotransferase n=1 Tax=Populus tomentosa TaxID=118781 RepID=L0AUM3_POPTO|nr:aminotransferase [Populus tomentosa]